MSLNGRPHDDGEVKAVRRTRKARCGLMRLNSYARPRHTPTHKPLLTCHSYRLCNPNWCLGTSPTSTSRALPPADIKYD